MFEEYKKDLLKFYQIKEKNDNLSDNLKPLGRERLRTECVEVFQKKNSQKDKDLIRPIFDPKRQHEDLERCIERYDLNKFRPLISYLTIEDRNIRNDKFVKLLAWLLDFPSHEEWREFDEEERRCVFEKGAKKHEIEDEEDTLVVSEDEELKNEGDTEEDPNVVDDEQEEDKGTEEDNPEPVYLPRFSSPQITITCILLLFITSTSFIAWERMATTVRTPKTEEKFMYWDNDHYEPIKDGEQKAGVTIIPLDLKTLQQQRKITLPDTMTKYSLGKVWYKGRGKDHEFFTDSGIYPPDTSRRLLPLSSTILKYSSYDRYLLNRLKWFLCAAFLISLGGYGVSRLKKEVKQPVEEEEKDHIRNISEIELA